MTSEGGRRDRLRSFVIGGVVGASAALATARRSRRRRASSKTPAGLAAFESAPCYRELIEHRPHTEAAAPSERP